MQSLLSDLFPVLYGACFLYLLWQAFRVMGRGFTAMPRLADTPVTDAAPAEGETDRTGRLTIHPELLDAEGRLTREDLLTVRFGSDKDRSA